MDPDRHIAVIGAGIVGLSCALWLQRKGFNVSLIDPADPGSGTSSGNACTIADYGCVPVNSPDVFKRLPKLLFSPDSPLSLRPGYVLRHPLWMLDFLLNCREKKVERSIRLLARLLTQTWDGLDPLLDMADARDLLERRGCLYLYRTEAEYVAMYCARRGLDGIPHWNFYLVFGFFRFAAILQGVGKRALDGNASSDKAFAYGALAPRLAEMALELID